MNQDSNVLLGIINGILLECVFLEMIYVVYIAACLLKQWVQ